MSGGKNGHTLRSLIDGGCGIVVGSCKKYQKLIVAGWEVGMVGGVGKDWTFWYPGEGFKLLFSFIF